MTTLPPGETSVIQATLNSDNAAEEDDLHDMPLNAGDNLSPGDLVEISSVIVN